MKNCFRGFFYVTVFCLFVGMPELLRSQSDSIYNDDPEQKIPLNYTKPAYARIPADGQHFSQKRVEPPHWWVGMAHPTVELLIYDQAIRDFEPSLNYPGVQIKQVTRLQNPNYLFVELEIGPGTKAGTFTIRLKKEGEERSLEYTLHERKYAANSRLGLNDSDFIYLLMPDRFANGDPDNDTVEGMNQQGTNRAKMYFRHGGDLQGVLDHLDYLESLGVTALWLNPVLENDTHFESYHGYAITDHYRIDRRFGTNETYLQLVEACHARGIKVVMDIIHNHVGDTHWFIQDLPDETWIHQFDEFTKTTYRAPTLMDPYASRYDRERMSDGWFDGHMPDLNQQHPQLATYLIQNNIWWVEFSGQDAYRIDTYAYPDQVFMAEWGKRMQKEYPDFNFFGETWVHGPAVQAQFTQNNQLRPDYNSYLPGVTDFQLYYAINEALQQEQGWTSGAARIYYTLAQDFLYEDPTRNVIFLDNHDLSRFFSVMGEDLRKFKSGLTFLMSMRGIPMVYYGTEILMKNFTDPDGKVREDFPGGWPDDPVDKFQEAGRTAQEQEAFSYLQHLALYRKQSTALQSGKLTQFVPENGIYVYFRQDARQTIMVAMNTHAYPQVAELERFQEMLLGFEAGQDIPTGVRFDLGSGRLDIPAFTTLLLELE